MMQEGSYLLIERGMPVRGTDADLGTVAQVVADAGVDVFRGLVLTHGFLPPRQSFIGADDIISVTGGTVYVRLSRADAEHLPPPSANVGEKGTLR
jgi:uncharacterized protein YrrD